MGRGGVEGRAESPGCPGDVGGISGGRILDGNR